MNFSKNLISKKIELNFFTIQTYLFAINVTITVRLRPTFLYISKMKYYLIIKKFYLQLTVFVILSKQIQIRLSTYS